MVKLPMTDSLRQMKLQITRQKSRGTYQAYSHMSMSCRSCLAIIERSCLIDFTSRVAHRLDPRILDGAGHCIGAWADFAAQKESCHCKDCSIIDQEKYVLLIAKRSLVLTDVNHTVSVVLRICVASGTS